jgi:sugar/nucleoside kinase (ribokinase family)
MEFIAIGDTVVDEFINLLDASVHCDVNNNNCTITMRWGDKIPYESVTTVVAVGNAANAAVSAARLGLSTAFISNVGKDSYGEQIIAALGKENIDTRYIAVNEGIPTNHHYALCYEAERTILIRHEAYPYHLPAKLTPPKWMYLSSVAEHTEAFHDELAAWLQEHPETKLTFQPGTFQMKMGKERLAALYAVSEVVAINKEEAARILGIESTDIKELLQKIKAIGPKIALITDGPNGAYAYDGTQMLKVPRYPDPRDPINRTGAGDAMASTFSVALALGKTLAEAMVWGPVNSMSVIQHVGAQKGLLSREALLKFIADAPKTYTAEPF